MTPLTLVSFDIDGTLEVGVPPGLITIAMVRAAQRLGCIIGSCSDRPLGYQRELWDGLGIGVDFTVLKHRLDEVRARFRAEAYYHVGDTELDEVVAAGAGFHFLRADAALYQRWGPGFFAGPDGGRRG